MNLVFQYWLTLRSIPVGIFEGDNKRDTICKKEVGQDKHLEEVHLK